ncbi:hypothetical protein CDAR_569331 [Caerostris darwini]|uniref:Uncharacterized protein n=1 Tax=Caerostris darwini TaxID=1538125 RepID=A0AAV4UDP3_9ARAC|nr:hypothetical protein CDAR_569331 [Caerostris darwini]
MLCSLYGQFFGLSKIILQISLQNRTVDVQLNRELFIKLLLETWRTISLSNYSSSYPGIKHELKFQIIFRLNTKEFQNDGNCGNNSFVLHLESLLTTIRAISFSCR